uniref:TF-B3 domain-containing protein n=1 Tax=Oryza nivara TaxID=4536 RepID=A0A0E0HXH0_ORYNI
MAAAAAPLADDGDGIVDRAMWLACAAPNSGRLPAVGSVVFYFVDGHAAQFCQFPAPLLEQLAVPGPRVFLCTVAAVRLRADALTNEAYAEITLDPVADHDVPRLAPAPAPAPAAAAGGQQLRYFVKTLMISDFDFRIRFSAPMADAKGVFPPLVDAKAVQPLLVKDLHGSPMTFDYGRKGKRVTLAKVWKKFRDDMDFVDGDSVIFMRRRDDDDDDGELYVGVRCQRTLERPLRNTMRRYRPPTPPQAAVQEAVLAAAGHAAAGERFTVAYRSRQDGDEFVVPREAVEEGLRARLTSLAEVEFVWAVEDGAPPIVGPRGKVTAIATGQLWRNLEIVWDGNSEMDMSANFWQVRPVEEVDISPSTPPPKRLKNCEIDDTASTSVSVDNGDEQVPTMRQRLEALIPDNI